MSHESAEGFLFCPKPLTCFAENAQRGLHASETQQNHYYPSSLRLLKTPELPLEFIENVKIKKEKKTSVIGTLQTHVHPPPFSLFFFHQR